MSEESRNRPKRTDRTQRMTGLLIVGVVIMAAISLMAGLDKKLFGPKEGPFQEGETVVMEVEEAPVADASGDAARPVDQDGANATALNSPAPISVPGAAPSPASLPASEEAGLKPDAVPAAEAVEPEVDRAGPAPSSALNVAPEPPAEAPAEMAEAPAPVKKTPAAKKPAAKQYIGRVMGLDFSSNYSSLTMTILTDRPVEEVTWFPVKNPRKIAIDLRGAWRPGIKPLHRFDEGIVEKVIVGEHPDRLRLVLWLRNAEGKAIAEPKIVKSPGGVDVTVTD